MKYTELLKIFSYKVQNTKVNKNDIRVTIDMGLHDFLIKAKQEVGRTFSIALMTPVEAILMTRADEYLDAAISITRDLSNVNLITDDVYLEALRPENRDIMKQHNIYDAQTIYNQEYWLEQKKALHDLNERR